MGLDFRGPKYPIGLGLRLSIRQAKKLEDFCRANDQRPAEVVRELISGLPDTGGTARNRQEPHCEAVEA